LRGRTKENYKLEGIWCPLLASLLMLSCCLWKGLAYKFVNIHSQGCTNPGHWVTMTINFLWWCLIFGGPQYRTCFMSLFWHLEFWGGAGPSVYTVLDNKFRHFPNLLGWKQCWVYYTLTCCCTVVWRVMMKVLGNVHIMWLFWCVQFNLFNSIKKSQNFGGRNMLGIKFYASLWLVHVSALILCSCVDVVCPQRGLCLFFKVFLCLLTLLQLSVCNMVSLQH
jgi:hypothetical protein